MRVTRSLFTASILSLPLFVGCSSGDCTELGCTGLQFELGVNFVGTFEPKTVRICEEDSCSDITLNRVSEGLWRGDGKAHIEWRENVDGATLSGYTYAPLPDVESEVWGFEVKAADGQQIYERKFNVTYEPVEVNGPGCGVCSGGVIEG